MLLQSLYRKLETYLQQNTALSSTQPASDNQDEIENPQLTHKELIEILKTHTTTLEQKNTALSSNSSSNVGKVDIYGRRNELR